MTTDTDSTGKVIALRCEITDKKCRWLYATEHENIDAAAQQLATELGNAADISPTIQDDSSPFHHGYYQMIPEGARGAYLIIPWPENWHSVHVHGGIPMAIVRTDSGMYRAELLLLLHKALDVFSTKDERTRPDYRDTVMTPSTIDAPQAATPRSAARSGWDILSALRLTDKDGVTVGLVSSGLGVSPEDEATEDDAVANMDAFVKDLEKQHHYTVTGYRRAADRDDGEGRYGFLLTVGHVWPKGSTTVCDHIIEIQMPGVPLDEVRPADHIENASWGWPRLYVEGSSWLWRYALMLNLEDRHSTT